MDKSIGLRNRERRFESCRGHQNQMHYIYKNHGTSGEVPHGVIYECDAEDITVADKSFAVQMGFKMSDKKAAMVATWSPDWSR